MDHVFTTIVVSALAVSGMNLSAAGTPIVHRDLEFARVGAHRLLLDLYLPAGVKQPPLLMWVHGGAWRAGSKNKMPLGALVDRGFAIASVDYRLTPVAKFPANLHDLKAAVRWLRAKSRDYGYEAGKIGIAGASAGGHLVNLLGVSNGQRELEGQIGDCRDQSSDVQAIVSLYGAANLTTILQQSTPHGLSVRVPALELLLGGRPEAKGELAKLASPVFHVDRDDPPLLMFHGDQDPQMPVNQSIELYGRYRESGLEVDLQFIHGAAHGGPEFYDTERIGMMDRFLRRCLK